MQVRNYLKKLQNRGEYYKIQVGCVITTDDYQIVAEGKNRILEYEPMREKIVPTVHAEIDAVIAYSKMRINFNNLVAFVTHAPCTNCIEALIHIGCTKIFYIEDLTDEWKTWRRERLLKSLENKVEIRQLKENENYDVR